MTFAYFSILIFFLMNVYCAIYAKKSANFTPADNRDPRAFLANTTGKAYRAKQAQMNGYEMFAPYAAAIIIAQVSGNASQFAINFWALIFLLSRASYICCYINDKSVMRSASWAVGALSIVALFITAF